MDLHVDSEVGRLKQVILHRPGLELARLTPDNVHSLLFDDVMWAERAREEHDGFADVLIERGVKVHYFADLLADVLATPEGLDFVTSRLFNNNTVGPELVAACQRLVSEVRPERLAEFFIGGILKQDVDFPSAHQSLLWSYGLKPKNFIFGHNVSHLLPDGRLLVDSYHCSGYNWRTGRLSRESFEAGFAGVKARRG